MDDLLQEYMSDYFDLVTVAYRKHSTVTEDGVPIRKLFVSNLAQRTSYKDLVKLFSKYGTVESCFIRRYNGKSNYAFVTFNNVESAVRARRRDTMLHNRNLRIEPADSWHQPGSIENQYYTKDWQKSDKKQLSEQSNEDFVESDIKNTIQMLNDDCLMHIFLQLSIIERIRMEMVCKRWRLISQKSWCNVKKLGVPYVCNSDSSIIRSIVSTNTFRKILLRCGKFLNEIDLSLAPYTLSPSTVTIVGKLCPNLQKINLTSIVVSAAGITSLTTNCHDIVKFSLGPTFYICDQDLQRLFDVNQKLRYLEIFNSKLWGSCLLHLPLEMKEIVLEECYFLQEIYLSQAIQKLRNLTSLTIRHFDISNIVMEALATYCTSLKKLELFDISLVAESRDMLHITRLTNLEVLKISKNNVVRDELLCNLASKCQQLTYIDISACRLVTKIGIIAITTLPKLETLIMNDMIQLTDITLRNMCNLKRLTCRNCNFTDNMFIELIASAPQLELLDLSACPDVTNLTLEKAATITRNRTNNIILRIFVGETSVNLKLFNEVSPFLHIVNVVFS